MTAPLPLRCTYCGAALLINTQTVGPAYLTYEAPESIECGEADCGAVWEPNGDHRTAAQWIEWPDLYTAPPRAAGVCSCPPGSHGRVMGMHKHDCPARSRG